MYIDVRVVQGPAVAPAVALEHGEVRSSEPLGELERALVALGVVEYCGQRV